MRWHELTVHTTEEAVEMISNFIHELGAGGVSIEESGTLNKPRDTTYGEWYELPLNDIPEGRVVIKGYFAEGSDMAGTTVELKKRIDELAEYGIDAGNPAIDCIEVDDEEWAHAWKAYFKPIRISDRLTIKPTWEEYEPQPEELVIELDPGMAFGTGTHATTALCLQTIERVVRPGDYVIDVGTGSGILAIAAAKLGAKHVLALDLDPVAVSSAKENAILNGLEPQITVAESDLLQALRAGGMVTEESGQAQTQGNEALGVELPVQVVVANILAEVVVMFVDDVYKALAQGGTYIASGIIEAKRPMVEEALTAAGLTVEERYYELDWVAIVARKR
ncbi:50S ribosomal protein L11 methyltransferase [Paenibacillus contaminans]|uniref:Ribosomal protein L11 methyltransferase n=1 Tax=Paenibacillus contaminans TaxID=450362 RepID=A0A329MS82_9BACL|nr:50S ribosomal protein L11 methyltransferase [Paenibacillus contaminans]RAV22148.1 50S ribosomal protein L11 methyltransferase [Paenibacillus contaminans]